MKREIKLRHIRRIFIGIGFIFILALVFKPKAGSDYFEVCEPFPTDAIEYHLPAANLALHNAFPYFGFIGPKEDYKLCQNNNENIYHQILEEASSIVFPSKPPLYSLLLGLGFKIFGYSPATALFFNLLCFYLIIYFLFVACYFLLGMKGLFVALITSILLCVIEVNLISFDAELLTALLVLIAFTFGVIAFRNKNAKYHLLFGCAMSLLVLCKGYFVFSVMIFIIIYLSFILKNKVMSAIYSLMFFLMGFLLFILPWVCFINFSIQNNIESRTAFHNKLKEHAPNLILNNHDEIYNANGAIRDDVIFDLMLFHQYQHAAENNFVFITNQLGEYNILNVHNEYCSDGDFHPEWRIIKTSFYNKHKDKDKNTKLFMFYRYHFLLGIEIVLAKIKNSITAKTFWYWCAIILLLFFGLKQKYPKELLTALIFMANVFLVLIVFYGDVRFVQTVIPLSILSIGVVLYCFNSSESDL